MSTTLSEIAKEVFDTLTVELDGVVKDITLNRSAKGDYDAETGSYPTVESQTSGRGLSESENALSRFSDSFPQYVLTGKETLWFCAEFDFAPKATDKFTVDGRTYEIKAVRDILTNGELFRVLVV